MYININNNEVQLKVSVVIELRHFLLLLLLLLGNWTGHSTKKCVHGLHLLILCLLGGRHEILHVVSLLLHVAHHLLRKVMFLFFLIFQPLPLLGLLSVTSGRVIWPLLLLSSFRTTLYNCGGISKVIDFAVCVFTPNCPGMNNIFHCNRILASKDFINLIVEYWVSKMPPRSALNSSP